MDEERFQTLLKKRDETGLSNEEADELGRMFAEREGGEYSNAETTPSDAAEEGAEAAETKAHDDEHSEPVEDDVRGQEAQEDRTSTNPA